MKRYLQGCKAYYLAAWLGLFGTALYTLCQAIQVKKQIDCLKQEIINHNCLVEDSFYNGYYFAKFDCATYYSYEELQVYYSIGVKLGTGPKK